MWFFIFLAYWIAPASSIDEPVPLIEPLPDAAFSTPVNYNHPSCYVWGARQTGIAWCATDNSEAAAQYVQVDFGETHRVDSVSTWPRKDITSQWVKTYTLSYSDDGETFADYGETFQGNTAGASDQEVNNVLDPDISCRYLRFTPLEYQSHKSMRVEAYGNKAAVSCDAFQIDEFLSSCSALFESNVNGISVAQQGIIDVNDRLDDVIANIGTAWDDLSAGKAMAGMPIIDDNYHDIDNGVKIKNWFNDYRDYLIVFSLALNVLVIAYVWCSNSKQRKYTQYRNVKYVDSSDENAAINM